MVTILYKSKIDNKELAFNTWNDGKYRLIINIDLIKRISLNKKDLMENIGYSRKFNLQGPIFYKKNNHEYIRSLF